MEIAYHILMEEIKMKKALCIILALTCFGLSGCTYKGVKNYTDTTSNRLQPIETESDLYYDKDTKIVYMIFNEFIGNTGYGYMSPYYSGKGRLYRYDIESKKIVELIPDELD